MTKTVFYTLACIISWSFIPIASKEILKGMNNFAMLFFSNIFSAFVILLYILITKKIRLLFSYSIKDLFIMFLLGFLGCFAFYVFLYKAFSMAKAQEVFIINYIWPILIVLFSSPILKEKLEWYKIVSIFISFVGVAVIISKGNPFTVKFTSIGGNILSLMAAICFALFSVLGKKVNYDQIVAVFIYFFSAVVFSIATTPLFKIEYISPGIVTWLLINGLIINGVSYIFWFKALKSTSTSIVSNAVYSTPFVSLLFIALILKEKIQPYSLIGLIFIIGGIGLQIYKESTL